MATQILASPAKESDPKLQHRVLIGIDTHKNNHVAFAIDYRGGTLAEIIVPACLLGYEALLEWALELAGGVVSGLAFGIEGTGSYGAGLSRYLMVAGCTVRDINRIDKSTRRRRGKDDSIDAEAAARSLLAGTALTIPKAGNAGVEMIRMLNNVRESAIHSRTKAINQLRGLVVVADPALREELAGMPTATLIEHCSTLEPEANDSLRTSTHNCLRILASRWLTLTAEIEELAAELDQLTKTVAPALRDAYGVGLECAAVLLVAAGDNPERIRSEASFAALCGASPLPASSGNTTRHRLNRGGNRRANRALWRIAITRMCWHPATKEYVERRTGEGKTKREIMRCLKRYIAREIFRLLKSMTLGNPLPSNGSAAVVEA
ncbi:MAG: IS110 family transposase [Cyanobium sp.]